jgi:hypothetical protein
MVIQYSLFLSLSNAATSTITPLVGINVTAAITANITANNVYSLSVSGGNRYWRCYFNGISSASTGTINIQEILLWSKHFWNCNCKTT